MIRNQYLIPLIQEILNYLVKAQYFIKLNIVTTFNQIRVYKGDKKYTAFYTQWGLFKYLVMPFGIKNSPSTFQQYINNILQEFLDVFVTAYINNILIYLSSLFKHQKHIKIVLKCL